MSETNEARITRDSNRYFIIDLASGSRVRRAFSASEARRVLRTAGFMRTGTSYTRTSVLAAQR